MLAALNCAYSTEGMCVASGETEKKVGGEVGAGGLKRRGTAFCQQGEGGRLLGRGGKVERKANLSVLRASYV